MADDNKIQFDIELNEGSVDSSFKVIDDRAVKSAKSSAAVFGEAFQKQEQDLQDSISRIVKSTKDVATKSAKESAAVFGETFKKQDEIYKASVKNSLDNAIAKITGSNAIKKSAQESASVFEEAFSKGLLKDGSESIFDSLIPQNGLAVRGLADLAGGFFLLKSAADVAFGVIKAGLEFIVEGEREIKLDRRFAALATQAGVASDVIKNQLTAATSGLVDETKLLEVGSEAFIKLGANAKALPQILELARKTYTAFGGDIVENTDKITNAIFSGQTRQLRGLGILIDTDKVYKEYARSLGTVVPLLSEQQRQTALLNAVLEKGREQFKNVAVDSDSAGAAFTRLAVARKNLGDALAIKTAEQSSGFFALLANGAAALSDQFTKLLTRDPIQKTKERIVELQDRLKQTEETLNRAQNSYTSYGRGGSAFFEKLKNEAVQLRGEIAKYQAQVTTAAQAQQKLAKDTEAAAKAAAGAGAGGVDTSSDEFLRRRQDLTLKVVELNNQVRASEVQLAQDQFTRLQNGANLEALFYQQKLQAAEIFNQQRQQLDKFYQENGVVDETLRQQGREALEQAHLNRMLQLQMGYEAQKKQIFIEGETQALTVGMSFQSVMEGINEQAQETSVNASKNFKNLGRSMLQSVGQASANAFAAFGQAIAQGDDALTAFGKSLLNSLGQMAIQMGANFILQGIAYTYAGLANGPPLIAAGAALAAFGGILSASGGAGPRDVSGGGGTAGGGIGSIADNDVVNSPDGFEDTEPLTPQTAVSVVINGNVLDRRETGLEIAKILEEQFADQGLVIRGA